LSFVLFPLAIASPVFRVAASYYPFDSNKNVDIKSSAQDDFLELPSLCTLKAKIFESQID
jgi:hypothetical protein